MLNLRCARFAFDGASNWINEYNPLSTIKSDVILNPALHFFEGEFMGIGVDFDSVAVGEFAG